MNKLLIPFLAISFMISSCMKDSFDKPNNPKDPDIIVNYTINDLKSDFKSSGKTIISISEDKIIAGVVSADDKEGNFYKQIVIQDLDNKAAIGVLINRSNLYNDFPVGRKVFFKLKGMAIASQNNIIVLGGYIDSTSVPGVKSIGDIQTAAFDKSVLKGSLYNEVKIDEIFINQLSEAYHYKLVKFKDVEFVCTDINLTYADAINLKDANRTLTDKNGNKVVVRTSGYSNFAGTKLALGKGNFTGIFTVYRTDLQMIIRGLNDVQLTDSTRTNPCGSSGGGGSSTSSTVGQIRALYSGNGVKIFDKFIEATVISDKDGKNINSQNIVVQDASGGIVIRFSTSPTYALGDKLKISFNGDSLTKFAGLMQVYVPSNAVSKIGTDIITPATVTVATINNNIDAYESTLVKIIDVTFSTTGTYNGSKTISDATSSITHYTASTATFQSSTLPPGPKTMTAIVGKFNTTKQVYIRNLSDVQ